MSFLFLRDALLKFNNYYPHNKIIFYGLFQQDLVIGLLLMILVFEVLRWNRLKHR